MAAPKKARLEAPVSCSSSGVGDGADVSKDVLAKLRAELEAEKKLVKQLKRDKSYDVQQVRDLEQNKATIAFKDLRTKLQQEKSKELEIQKEALTRKFDLDLQKGTKLKELELAKVQGDLKRCQEELQQVTKRGLSGAARGAFEAERSKLLQEAKELRAEKRHLEETLRSVTDADKQKAHELRRLQDSRKSDIAKTKKEADIEIRKLLDEVRSKERVIGNLEKDAVSRQDGASHVTKLQMENESMEQLLSLAKEASSWERRSSKTHNNGLTPPAANGSDYIPTEKGSPPPGQDESPRSQPVTTEDFQSQIEALRVQCSAYQQDKTDLLQKIKDMDKKNRLQIEKNKKFLEKNMELTNINRSLEDKIKKLNEETGKLKHQLDRSKRENLKLSEQLTSDSTVKETSIAVKEELEDLRRQTEEQEKAVAALKLACSEKDRRIELLAHRQRKTKLSRSQQKMVRFLLPAKLPNVAAGIKETYFGFEEDTLSIDSEMSNSSRMSSSCLSPDISMEDEVFDEFTREEFEKNYQRLSREHMELEKSYALLQGQVGQSHVDPGREIKLRSQLENDLLDSQSRIEDLERLVAQPGQDLGWLLEKETLNKTVRMLKEKVHNQEKHEGRILHQTREIQEQNEVLEFRVLELEEANEKLMKEVSNTVTFMGAPILTENGVLQMMAVEMGMVQVGVSELKEKILDIKFKQVAQEDQLALLQTHALLDASDKKLKDTQTTLESLRGRIKTLEEEKADLLSAATGVSPDLVLEHEDTRNQLAEANVRIQQLEAELEELRKREAIYKYTEQVNLKTESRYKKEISTLSRQLSNSSEGRDYERELWEDNIERLKTAERELTEQQAAHKALLDQVKALEQDRSGLERHLEHIQDHQDLAESDKDTNTLLHSIQCKLDQKEKSEVELMEKAQNLEAEVSSLRSRMAEYEANEAHLTDRNVSVQEELEKVRERCCHLEAELVNTKEARDKDVEKLRNTVHSLEKESEAAAQRVEELQGSSAGLEAANTQLSQEVASLQAAKAELERLQQIRDDATEMDSTRGTLQIKLGELQTLVEQRSATTTELENQVTDFDSVRQRLETKVQDLETINAELMKRIVHLEEAGAEASNTVHQLTESKADLDTTRADVRGGDESLSEHSAEKLKEFETEIISLTVSIEGYKARITNLETTEQELQSKITILETLNQDLTENGYSLGKAKKDLENEVIELKTKERVLQEEVKDSAEKLNAVEAKFAEAQKQLSIFEADKLKTVLNLQGQVSDLESNQEKLNESINELKDVELVLRGKLDEYERSRSGASTPVDSRTVSQHKSGASVGLLEDGDVTREDEPRNARSTSVHDAAGVADAAGDERVTNCDIVADSDTAVSTELSGYRTRVFNLEMRVEELTKKETDLVEELRRVRKENHELLKNVSVLRANDHENTVEERKLGPVAVVSANSSLTGKPPETDDLFRDSSDKAKRSSDAKFEEMEQGRRSLQSLLMEKDVEVISLRELKPRLQQSEEHVRLLTNDIEDLRNREKAQMEKMELLQISESKLLEQIETLEEVTAESSQKEKELTEELQQVRMHIQELQDNSDNQICSDEREIADTVTISLRSSPMTAANVEHSNDDGEVANISSDTKMEEVKAELRSLRTLLAQKDEDLIKMTQIEPRFHDAEENVQKLKRDLEDLKHREDAHLEKIDLLQISESKLFEQIEYLEEVKAHVPESSQKEKDLMEELEQARRQILELRESDLRKTKSWEVSDEQDVVDTVAVSIESPLTSPATVGPLSEDGEVRQSSSIVKLEEMKEELSSLRTLLFAKDEELIKMSEFEPLYHESDETVQKLRRDIEELKYRENAQLEKVDLLQISESKLLEQIEYLEEVKALVPESSQTEKGRMEELEQARRRIQELRESELRETKNHEVSDEQDIVNTVAVSVESPQISPATVGDLSEVRQSSSIVKLEEMKEELSSLRTLLAEKDEELIKMKELKHRFPESEDNIQKLRRDIEDLRHRENAHLEKIDLLHISESKLLEQIEYLEEVKAHVPDSSKREKDLVEELEQARMQIHELRENVSEMHVSKNQDVSGEQDVVDIVAVSVDSSYASPAIMGDSGDDGEVRQSSNNAKLEEMKDELSSLRTLLADKDEDLIKMKELEPRFHESEDNVQKLRRDIEDLTQRENAHLEKIDLLQISESKLLEQIEYLEEVKSHVQESSQKEKDAREELEQARIQIQKLRDNITELREAENRKVSGEQDVLDIVAVSVDSSYASPATVGDSSDDGEVRQTSNNGQLEEMNEELISLRTLIAQKDEELIKMKEFEPRLHESEETVQKLRRDVGDLKNKESEQLEKMNLLQLSESKRLEQVEYVEKLEKQVKEHLKKEIVLTDELQQHRLQNLALRENTRDKDGNLCDQDMPLAASLPSSQEKCLSEAKFEEMRLELSSLQTLLAQKDEELISLRELKLRLQNSEENAQTLMKDFADLRNRETTQLVKLDLLQDSERKLLEQIEYLEDNCEKLDAQLERQEKSGDNDAESVSKRIDQLDTRDRLLNEKQAALEKSDLNADPDKCKAELTRLQEKVDILLDTEERLVDRITEQEAVEVDLREKLNSYQSQIQQLETQIDDSEARINDLLTHDRGTPRSDDLLKDYVPKDHAEELANTTRVLRIRLADVEKSEVALRGKIADLSDKMEQLRNQETALSDKAREAEKRELVLQIRYKDVESQNEQLRASLDAATKVGNNPVTGGTDDYVDVKPILRHSARQDMTTSPTMALPRTRDVYAGGFASSATEGEDLKQMSREGMISRVHELELMEVFHREKIQELQENLKNFRYAVEILAITMEKDTDVPIFSYKGRVKDVEFEARVQQLLKAEVTLKLKVLSLQKKDAIMRSQLQESEQRLRTRVAEHQADMNDLERELDQLRKSEAKLRNKLQYGSTEQESQALAKIQRLEELVFDLESAERKLKRQVHDLQESEAELKARLTQSEASSSLSLHSALHDIDIKDRERDLEKQLQMLESSEKTLKEKLEKLDVSDSTAALLSRVAELERSERSLRLKLELMESQAQHCLEEDTPSMLDSPEAVLRQRIRDFEKHERHLKQQVGELEKDREELHDITRRDKSLIHELNLQIRELQLSENNLKEQVNTLEAEENKLHLQVSDMADRVEDLQNLTKRMQTAEQTLNVKVRQQEENEVQLSNKLENTRDNMNAMEQKFKKKNNDLEKERRDFAVKVDELTDRVGDLEGVEMTLKQKVRNLENSETSLKEQLEGLERSEEKLKRRTSELESLNESLAQKVHKLEEEKANLLYEMSDLEMFKEEHMSESDQLKKNIRALKDQLDDTQGRMETLQGRLDEMARKEVELQATLGQKERSEKDLRDHVTGLERVIDEMRRQLEAMSSDVTATASKLQNAGHLERENNFLQGQMERHLVNNNELTEDREELLKKVKFYENSADVPSVITLPQQEVADLRRQAALLDETQSKLTKAEKSEKNLRDTVAKLRQGKDACGHEAELADLKKLSDQHNAAVQAHEVLKMNYGDLKNQLKNLQYRVKSGEVELLQRSAVSSKATQVRLAESYTLRQLAPEFRNAMKNLGARHPQAYHDFTHDLQPQSSRRISRVHTHDGPDVAMPTVQNGVIAEETVEAQHQDRSESSHQAAPPCADTQVLPAERAKLIEELIKVMGGMDDLELSPGKHDGDKGHAVDGVSLPPAAGEVNHYEPSDGDRDPDATDSWSESETSVSSLDESPAGGLSDLEDKSTFVITKHVPNINKATTAPINEVAVKPFVKGDQKTQPKRPLEAASEDERRALIGQLVEALPGASPEPASEDPLWRAVEGKSLEGAAGEKELPYWKEVEGKNTDDMALTVELWGWRDDSGSDASGPVTPHRGDAVLKGPPPGARTPTSTEAPPPPLPTSLPPTSRPPRQRSESPTNDDSYYPPSHHGYDSADEASEIVDEDDGAGVRLHVKPPRGTSTSPSSSSIQLRAKSLERLLPDRSLDADSRRAKSVERDSDFSEGSFLGPSPSPKTWGRTRGGRRMPGSLESIPDSGMESFRQDDVINSMKDRIHNLETQLKNKEEELNSKVTTAEEDSKRKIHHIQKEIDVLRQQLDRKNKELNAQNNEVVRLTDEVRRLNDQRQTVTKDTSLPERHRQLQQRLEDLQKQYQALLDQNPVSGKPSEDKIALEKIVLKLRGQLKDFDRIELERQDLQKKLSVLEEEYKLKVKSESELTKENAKLRHQLDSFSKENKQLQAMEDDYIKVRVKFDEMEQIKSKALTMITPLRAKVMRLAQKCKSKDELIARLASVLRRTGEPSDVLAEADRVTAQAASEEYSRPISPLTLQTLQAFETELSSSEATTWFASKHTKPSKIPRRARRSSGDSSGTHSDSSASDIEALLDANVSLNGFPKSDSHTAAMATRDNQSLRRSHSTDDLGGDLDVTPCRHGVSADDDVAVSSPHVSLLPVTLLNTQSDLCSSGQEPTRGSGQAAAAASSRRDKRTRSAPTKDTYNGAAGAGVAKGLFRAVKDYEPKDFSYSGHQKLELPLKEGDLVKVLGPVDGRGYQEAEVNGKLGLVPALYLLPASPPETRVTSKHRTTQLPSSQANGSPEQILAMYEHLKQVHVPKFTVPSSPSIASPPATAPSRRSLPATLTHPAYQRNAVLPPVSPRSLGVGHPAFSLQGNQAPGATSSGPPEPPSNFRIQRIVGESSVLLSWAPPPMDELARSNGTAVRGYKILIDNRDKQTVSSPHLTKALIEKLNLRRAHSFSIQTLALGGLTSRMADTLFDDVMPEQGPDGAGQAERDWTAPDVDVTSVLSSTVTDDGERRVFLAVYDYKPTEHSPQNFPGQEVAFKTGDVIVTYGGVREDGFYYGKVHGKKGLVPASFMEEVALLRPRGRRSASSSSCASYQYSSSTLGSASRLSSAPSSRPLSSQSTHSYQSRKSSGSSKVATATV